MLSAEELHSSARDAGFLAGIREGVRSFAPDS
jgi:hypothetical protein